MAEIFKEYLVKQNKSVKDLCIQGAIVALGILIAGAAFVFGGAFIGPLIIVAVIFGAGTLFSRFNKEYEYILTNNELDIDVIYNKAKRKRVLTINMKKIEVMASIKDNNHKHETERFNKLINASDNKNDAATYAIVSSQDGTLCKILITPNESLLKAIYQQAPHKVFINR